MGAGYALALAPLPGQLTGPAARDGWWMGQRAAGAASLLAF